MLSNHSSVPLAHLIKLFCALFIAGILLTLPLYQFDFRKFVRTKLFIKIVFWVPIFIVFVVLLYLNNAARLCILLILVSLTFTELLRALRHTSLDKRITPIIFYLFLSIAQLHFYILGVVYKNQLIELLIIICFASVLSDVTAFFMGNYVGKHKLPAVFNNKKSWEGVAGQILGALGGVLLVDKYIVHVSIVWIFLPIGLGAAVGDLANSHVKHLLAIKDWSNSIPGHGGYIDRLSSLVGSALFTFYFLKLFHVMLPSL